MFSSAVNSKKRGDIGLGAAIFWFAKNGVTVSIPLTDSQDYDLVVDMGGLKRVQVKTTSNVSKSGSYEVGLRVCGGNRSGSGKIKKFNKNKIDLLFVLDANGATYLIPSSQLNVTNSISLNAYKKFIV